MDKFFENNKFFSTQKIQPFKTHKTVLIKNGDKDVIGMFLRDTSDGHNRMMICDPEGRMLSRLQSEDGDTSFRTVKKMMEITDENEKVIGKFHAKNAMGATWYIDDPSGENVGEIHVGIPGDKILDKDGEQIGSIGMSAGDIAKRFLSRAISVSHKSWNVSITKEMEQDKKMLFTAAALLLSVITRYPAFIS